jgi:hypothetical protein
VVPPPSFRLRHGVVPFVATRFRGAPWRTIPLNLC